MADVFKINERDGKATVPGIAAALGGEVNSPEFRELVRDLIVPALLARWRRTRAERQGVELRKP